MQKDDKITFQKIKRTASSKIATLFVILMGLVFSFPLYWMITGSLKTNAQNMKIPPFFMPPSPTFDAYFAMFKYGSIERWFFNSVLSALGVAVLTLILASTAAYSLAKKYYPGRDAIFTLIILSLMIPRQLSLVPSFVIMRDLGLINNLLSIILPTACIPLSVFLLRQFSVSVPNELLNAAKIDGCSEIGIFTWIFLPIIKPAIGAVLIFTFTLGWNDYLWQLVMLTKEKSLTLPLGVTTLVDEFHDRISERMAASTVAFIPLAIVFISFQKYFVKGITVGSIKG